MIFYCYKLIEDKHMSDGVLIPLGEKLFCLKNEEDILFLIYEDRSDEKNKYIFWARIEEVEFVGEEDKEFDIDLTNIINGNYFDLI